MKCEIWAHPSDWDKFFLRHRFTEMVLGKVNPSTSWFEQESHCLGQWEIRVASCCQNRQILETQRVWHRLCRSELLLFLTLCPLSACLATRTFLWVIRSVILWTDIYLLWKLQGEDNPLPSSMENTNNEIGCSQSSLHCELRGFTNALWACW